MEEQSSDYSEVALMHWTVTMIAAGFSCAPVPRRTHAGGVDLEEHKGSMNAGPRANRPGFPLTSCILDI
jgi:hypothetical protein